MKGVINIRGSDAKSQSQQGPSSPLPPSMSVRPLESPLPSRRISIHVTQRGLVLVPKSSSHQHHQHHRQQSLNSSQSLPLPSGTAIRLSWEKRPKYDTFKVSQVEDALQEQDLDCQMECSGIVGVLKLFSSEQC